MINDKDLKAVKARWLEEADRRTVTRGDFRALLSDAEWVLEELLRLRAERSILRKAAERSARVAAASGRAAG